MSPAKPFPWEVAGAAVLVCVAILGAAAVAIGEHRRANALELRFENERRERRIYARCHYWSLEGYAIAEPNDCLTFDPVAWRRSPLPGSAR